MSTSWNTKTAIEQIESCNFECEAGPLKNNTAWAWLKSASLDPAFNNYDEALALLREAVEAMAFAVHAPAGAAVQTLQEQRARIDAFLKENSK